MATDMETTSGTEGTLSTWAGPYITDMLGRTTAYAALPYQPYTGQLTAGTSDLENKAFQGIAGLTVPGAITGAAATLQGLSTQQPGADAYKAREYENVYQAPGQYEALDFAPTAYSQEAIQPYMNPYLESVLAPQRRKAEEDAIRERMAMQGRMAQAGAYGGSRQALMESEGQKNLQQLLADITGKGYASAFDVAQKEFGNEQERLREAAELNELSRQFGAKYAKDIAGDVAKYGLDAEKLSEESRQYAGKYGLDALNARIRAAEAATTAGKSIADIERGKLDTMLKAGAAQREAEQAGLTADYNEFKRELAYPKEMLQFEREMISGIPGVGATSSYGAAASPFQSAAGGAATVLELLKLLGQAGE